MVANYDPTNWGTANVVNRCLSAATSALYGITEAAILAAGYAPAIGFLHSGKPQSFVYDIADVWRTTDPPRSTLDAFTAAFKEHAIRRHIAFLGQFEKPVFIDLHRQCSLFN